MHSKNHSRIVHYYHVFANGTNAPIAKSMIAINKQKGSALGSLCPPIAVAQNPLRTAPINGEVIATVPKTILAKYLGVLRALM